MLTSGRVITVSAGTERRTDAGEKAAAKVARIRAAFTSFVQRFVAEESAPHALTAEEGAMGIGEGKGMLGNWTMKAARRAVLGELK